MAIQCLCVLSRIDHDLVEASTSHILPKFLTVLQSPHGEFLAIPAREFLSLALSFHAKTRTLPAHISHLIDSCAPQQFSSPSTRTIYDGLVASPALALDHLNKLSMAVRTFITPGQTLDTARRVLVMLQEIWERFRDIEKAAAADRGKVARKKRRTSQNIVSAGNEDADARAVTFVLAARIVAVVLTSLPLHTITEAERARAKSTVVVSLDGFLREAILAGTGTITSRGSDGGRDVWATQVVAAAALRLRYTLQLSGHTPDSLDDRNDFENLVAAILQVDNCLPEYSIENVSLTHWDHSLRAHEIESFVTYCTPDFIVTPSSNKSYLMPF
jgi:hypothetical protein